MSRPRDFLRFASGLPVLLALLAMVVPAIALAHAVVFPKTSRPGAYEKYVLRVPNERDVPTIRVEMRFPEGLVLDEFNVPVCVLLVGRLIHHDLNAGTLGATQDRFDRLGIVGNDPDHIDLLGDQVLNGADLLRRIVSRRIYD